MRPVWTLLLVAALIGGMAGYIKFANSVSYPTADFSVDYAQGKLELVIERSFECVPYELAETKALEVGLKGKVVYSADEVLPVDREVRFTINEGVEVGDNEVSIVANRNGGDAGLGALQATVFWNDIPIAEKTITADKYAEIVSGTLLFHVDDPEPAEGHQH